MQTLYLIRHTTPAIAAGICYGQLDIDVADSFSAEAKDVLRYLPPPQLILTSPLLRTRRLAEHLAQAHGCELRSDSRLLEKHFGAWEGKAWDDIARSEIDAWADDFMGYASEGGESAQQVMQRVQSLLREVAQLPQENIALVAHAGSIRAMLAVMGGVELEDVLEWEVGVGAVIGVKGSSRN
jgi:alpha-ribazole phosphatase